MCLSRTYFAYIALLAGALSTACGSVQDDRCMVACDGSDRAPKPTPAPAPDGKEEPAPPTAPAPDVGYDTCASLPQAPADRAPSAATLLAPATKAISLALDANNVYFSTLESDTAGTVWVVPKAGGTAKKIADVVAYDLETADDRVFAGGGGRELVSFDPDGANRKMIRSFGVFDFQVQPGGGDIFFTDLANGVFRTTRDGKSKPLAQGQAQGLALKGDWVYWADYAKGTILRVPRIGGTPSVVYDHDGFVRSVAFDCKSTYVSLGNYGDGTAAIGEDATSTVDVGGTMALDTAALYVVNREYARRVSLATKEITILGDGPRGVGGKIATDDDAVYWTSETGILRALK